MFGRTKPWTGLSNKVVETHNNGKEAIVVQYLAEPKPWTELCIKLSNYKLDIQKNQEFWLPNHPIHPFRATANIWPKPKSWQECNNIATNSQYWPGKDSNSERNLLQIMAHLRPGRILLSFNFSSMLFYNFYIQMFCPEIHSKFEKAIHQQLKVAGRNWSI